ncbi:MAG: hypothetical protein EBT57_00380 [Verrucomicrobia bacterium]|nr:hypothetical protein [Verrucomicrobiota bacterium]
MGNPEQDRPMPQKSVAYGMEQSIHLKADPRDVFDFHLHPKNLSRVNPPGLRILSLEAPETIREGSQIHLKVSSWGIPQRWEVVVREVRDFAGTPAKASILDEAIQGPFPLWRHWHEFGEEPDGSTRMVDRVEFIPPGGPAGFLMLPVIRWLLLQMFIQRHKATRRIFENS